MLDWSFSPSYNLLPLTSEGGDLYPSLEVDEKQTYDLVSAKALVLLQPRVAP